MPEAIATTKRKFYKALDSVTNDSKVSPDSSRPGSSSNDARTVTATEAFDAARERASKRLRQSGSSSSFTSIPPRNQVAPAPSKSVSTSSKTPNFTPWSHETFLARLKTFSSVSLWHPKPDAISEVEWAMRGWVCVAVNTVGCRGGCEKRVVVSLDLPKRKAMGQQEDEEGDKQDDLDDENDEIALEKALAERYKGMIVEGHSKNCLWRQSGCKDDIYHLQVVRPAVWQPDLRRRYESIIAIGDSVQQVAMQGVKTTESVDTSPQILFHSLPPGLLGTAESMPDSPLPVKALMVALHGWQGLTQSGTELLQCEACFQRIGLWMYQPDYKPATVESDEDEESASQPILELDGLHRDHCPWHNPITQKSSGSLSGLSAAQILYRVVSTYAREHRRRSDFSKPSSDGDPAGQGDDNQDENSAVPVLSKDQIIKQDKERESKLRRLKSLFSIKRRSTKIAPKTTAS